MSTTRRSFISLLCDGGCGARLDTECIGGIGARVEGAQKGWRYAEGIWLCVPEQQKAHHRRNGKEQTLRAIDICPTCEVPPQGTRITRAEDALTASERRSTS